MSQANLYNATQGRHRLAKVLQLQGYSACREALVLLAEHYASSTKYDSIDQFIAKLNRVITFHTAAGTSIIDPDLAHLAIKKLSDEGKPAVELGNESGIEENLAPVHLTVKVKNVECPPQQQQQQQPKAISIGQPLVQRSAALAGDDFNIHYNFLFKRLQALPLFKETNVLTKLSTLNGSSQPTIRCICFGLLVKDLSKIDGYLLIDSSGRVPLRITHDTTFRNKVAYANCMLLVEGVYVNPDDVLFAANIGLPPILLDPLQDKRLACRDEKMVVILRDLYMDDEDVCKCVELLFTGYNSMGDPPIMFILMGDFTRKHYHSPTNFRSHAKKLVRIIRGCDNLTNCHFVFVPGPKDTSPDDSPKGHNVLPKQALTQEQLPVHLLTAAGFQNVHLATNPTHIYLGDRRISLVSHSYLKELPKGLLHDLTDRTEEFFENAKQIMLANAHLSAGISKTYPSQMNLWNRPDLLVLADTQAIGNKFDYNSSKSQDTTFTTMPSFSLQYSQFKVYYLKSGEIEDSQVSSHALEQLVEVSDDEEEQEEEVEEVEEEKREVGNPEVQLVDE